MKKENYLLASDFDEYGNQYFFIYDPKTLELIKSFDSAADADKFFNSISE